MDETTQPISGLDSFRFDIEMIKVKLNHTADQSKKNYDLLVVSNGKPSIVDQLRFIDTRLLELEGTIREYIEGMRLERESKKKAESELRQRIFLLILGMVLSGLAWFVFNTYNHLVLMKP